MHFLSLYLTVFPFSLFLKRRFSHLPIISLDKLRSRLLHLIIVKNSLYLPSLLITSKSLKDMLIILF